MVYDMSQDIMWSVFAFLGLASMVFCYWDGVTTKMDYVLFAIIFFVFGYYCNYLYGEQYKAFPFYGGIAYAVGVLVTLFLNKKYRAWHKKKSDGLPTPSTP